MTTIKDFVKETLAHITAAVKEHNETQDSDYRVGFPDAVNQEDLRAAGYVWGKDQITATIEFDMAITVGSETKGGGEASLKVAEIFKVGGDAGVLSQNTSVNRVKFPLPMVLPRFKSKKTKKKGEV
ncbi:hypothetical protein QMT40_001432 [Parvibaculaceae bacterium PLY_AMNH_Bact1]|nr:hypothetical protein QMT40_001432 [Parvibaculaceae bacterium PLY_AMNH_Bact1]